jgi:hypothetical protein
MNRASKTKYKLNRVTSISLSQANARAVRFYFGEKKEKRGRKGGNSGEKN